MGKREESSEETKGRRQPLQVVCRDGMRQRFLRGMITSDLVRRGVDFEQAYAISRAVRDQLSQHDEVKTSELRERVAAELLERLDPSELALLTSDTQAPSRIQVVYHGRPQPFSVGLLARSVQAAGIELDQAYQIAARLESILHEGRIHSPSSDEIALRTGELLERDVGFETAQRYRLVRHVHQLPRPLILYIGGASGTGKSTLAMELAPLLRIFRIIATDTIRQVMRMVFTPAILPAIHASSFEPQPAPFPADTPLGAARDPDLPTRLISSFEDQATRVCVGVRAVVERAIAENMSIIVEGVHLHPGLVPFHDLDGEAYQVPLILSTLHPEVHRPRFLSRARRNNPERYLRNFGSIRIVHDHLLQEAESNDVPLMDTSEGPPDVGRMMRLVTGAIDRRFPQWREAPSSEPVQRVPTLMLCIDGLADRPVRALGGRTPLQAAATPTLDRLAREGRCGLANPMAPGVVADTASGSLALFGQSPLALERGPVEAFGAGLSLDPEDIALRGNFATLDDEGILVDRRAGRIRAGADELAEALDRLDLKEIDGEPVRVRVKASTEHRVAIALVGAGLSPEIQGSDPGEGVGAVAPLTPRPFDADDPQAARTARILDTFEQAARRVLARHPINRERRKRKLHPANALLTRGAGRTHRLAPLRGRGAPRSVACISGDRTIRGIAKLVGAHPVKVGGATANLDTDLKAKFEAARKALKRNDLVVLHVKGADIAAHDRRPDLKVAFLEKLDRQLAGLLKHHSGDLRVAVASDHATLSESGQHAADPVPVLIWGSGIEADDVKSYDEQAVGSGALETLPLQTLLGQLFELD